MRLHLCRVLFIALACLGRGAARVVHVALDWETGEVSSGLPAPLKPSFSINGNGFVAPKDPANDYCQPDPSKKERCWPESAGKTSVDGGKSIHVLSVKSADWARKGQHVLKVYADGRKYGKSSGDYAFRCELSAVQDAYVFLPGDWHFYSMSFWLDESWDQVSKYSGLLMQWKMSPGFPHGALRISNLGDYKLFFRGYHLWEDDGNGKFIGHAKRAAWNDIKFFYKKSMGKDGFVLVWLNGKLVFEHKGRTLLKSTQRGYTKFGQYTEIRDERTVYYDAVEFCHTEIDYKDCLAAMGYSNIDDWIRQGQDAPVVYLTRVHDRDIAVSAPATERPSVSMPLGENVTLVALAQDSEGAKYASAGGVASVSFFAGNCSLGTVSGRDVRAGNFTLTSDLVSFTDSSHTIVAVATDTDGNVVKSSPVTLHVGNQAPTVRIAAPADLTNVASGASVEISVRANDADGSVVKVDVFVDGDHHVGTATSSVSDDAGLFKVSWQAPASSGAHTITAVATDNAGRNATTTATQGARVTVGAEIATAVLTPTQDSTIRESSPSTTSNWRVVEAYGKRGGENVALLQFDLTAQRTAQHSVRSAVLRLFPDELKNAPGRFAVHATTGQASWSEKSVNWNNSPSKSELLASREIIAKGQYVEFDVTSHVRQHVMSSAGQATLTFWVAGADKDYELAKFQGRRADNKNKPELVVSTSSVAPQSNQQAGDGGTDAFQSCAFKAHASTVSIDDAQVSEVGGDRKDGASSADSAIDRLTTTAPSSSSDDSGGSGSGDGSGSSGSGSANQGGEDVLPECSPNETTLLAISDASIRQAYPAEPGDWGNIEVYGKPGGGAIASLLRFNLSGILAGVEKAQLKLYSVVGRNTPGSISVFRLTEESAWNESSVAWSTAPARGEWVSNFTVDQLSEDRPGEGVPEGYYIVDVSTAVASHLATVPEPVDKSITFWLEDLHLDYLAVKFESRREDKLHPPLLSIVASQKVCDAVVARRFDVSVPDPRIFLQDTAAKSAICEGVALQGLRLPPTSDWIKCEFLTDSDVFLTEADFSVKLIVVIPGQAGAAEQSRVTRQILAMTAADVGAAVAAQMVLAKGQDIAGDFQVIVDKLHEAVRGGVEMLPVQSTPTPSKAEESGKEGSATPSPSTARDAADAVVGSSLRLGGRAFEALGATAFATALLAFTGL